MLERQTLRRAVSVGYRLLLLWFVPIATFLAIFMWKVLFVSGPAASPKPDPFLNAPDPDYVQKIRQSFSVQLDEFGKYFRTEPIVLSGPFSAVSSVEIGHGHIAVIDDLPEPSVYLFDSDGGSKTKLGSAGNGPGKYVTPSDVAVGDSFAAVSDFTSKRVSVFGFSGELNNSFAYGSQGFSASAVAFDQPLSELIVFGNKWPKKAGDKLLLVHQYSMAGQYLSSTFVLPESGVRLGLEICDQPIVRQAKNEVWFMLPWDYRVFRILGNGSTDVVFDTNNPRGFKPPSNRPPVQPKFAIFQHWRLSWTPIVSFASDGTTLLVEKECFCDARYGIDVWSLRTGQLLKQFSTNWKVLGYDGKSFYSVREKSEDSGKHGYEFEKAVLADKL